MCPDDVLLFQDTEDLSASLRHANVRAIQTSRGGFSGRLAQRGVADWTIQYVSIDDGMSACAGDAPRDRYSFVVPLRVTSGSRLLGADVTGASLGIYAPGSEHADITTPGFSEVIVMPPLGSMGEVLASANGVDLPRAGSHHRQVQERHADRLRLLLGELGRLDESAAREPEIVRSLIDGIGLSLRSALGGDDGARLGRPTLPRPEILRRVADILESRPDEPIYATELAAMAQVSQPTLQRAFLELFGMPPARYLMLKRIYLARARLRSGSYQSVIEVASSCGFWELSRFAKRYKTIFGELPSETLRRSRPN